MTLLSELLGTAEGQLSLVVLVFMLGMGVFFARMFFKKMNEETTKRKK